MRVSAKVAYALGLHLVAAGCGELMLDTPAQDSYRDGGGVDRAASEDDGGSDGARNDEAGSTDGATSAPRCGDGVVKSPDACDDKNNGAGDGCDATCHVEPGWSCVGSPSLCTPVCGDGVVTGSELCDDGNTDDGDTCPSTCHRELWSKRYGDGSNQSSIRVAVDATGDAVSAGTYSGTVDFGGGPLPAAGDSDVFIAKVDPAGKHVWSRHAGSLKQADRGTGVAIDAAHDVVVTGVFIGAIDFGGGPLFSSGSWDIFVVKFDAAGNHLWSKRFGDSAQQQTTGVAVDAAGNIVITGTFWGTVDFGGGPLTGAGKGDIFVAKLDANGNHVWSRRFGDATYQNATSVAVSAAGDVYVTGERAGMVDFGGGSPGDNTGDAFLLALDVAGQHRWSRRWGASNNPQGGTGVAVDPAGDVLVTGYCQGPLDLGTGVLTGYGYFDVFLGKFSSAGVPILGRRIGSNQQDEPSAVAADGSGNILLTGYYEGPIDFGGGPLTHVLSENAFVAKLDPSGAHIWSRGYGTLARGFGIAADALGRVFAAGTFWNSITFGPTTHTSAGGDDLFLAKLAP